MIQEEVDVVDSIVEIEYVPYTGNFILPTILPQTGTPLSQRVEILENPLLSLAPPTWATPDTSMTNTDITYWKDIVLPYAEDRNEEEYIVIPSIGVIVPLNYVPQGSSDYRDITQDGIQIKDYSNA